MAQTLLLKLLYHHQGGTMQAEPSPHLPLPSPPLLFFPGDFTFFVLPNYQTQALNSISQWGVCLMGVGAAARQLCVAYGQISPQLSIINMNWRHHQRIAEDADDQQFLEEGSDVPQEQPLADDQVDPLDAFMEEMGQANPDTLPARPSQMPQKAEDDEDYADEEGQSFPDQARSVGSDDQILSNEQLDCPERKQQRKIIEGLKPFDFSKVELRDFDKNFYSEHPEIGGLPEQEVRKYMKELEIKVAGVDVPRPIVSFGHLNIDDTLKRLIVKNHFEKPTPIQAIGLPAALSGRDVVGIAKTGSGKTLAYVWPMIVHVSHQGQSGKGQGPVAVVLAPTRELCQQIYVQTKKYSKKYGLKVACVLGGENKHEQWKALKAGVDVLIASPGRLIEMIKKKATNLVRVTYLVLDEADRMLSLGFEQQIRSIVSQTREDRQTLLFTATMKKQMQFLVSDVVSVPVRINVGEEGAANQDVRQQVVVVEEREQKMGWLQLHLRELLREGKILVFANQRETCQEIGKFIEDFAHLPALVMHGDKNQYERTVIMNAFKADRQILVATDIAARGIDVKNIKTVVNFECPKQIQAYIHRIGRAGRAGETGVAYTFLTPHDVKFAISLVKTFENSGYPVPQQLQDLACLDDFFKRKRLSAKMGVSFAKGNDASKFLTQILHKQRRGFSRAGLGMTDPDEKKSYQNPASNTHILSGEKNLGELSISEMAALIREKHQKSKGLQQKFGKFVMSSTGQMKQEGTQATVTFAKPK